VCNRKLDYHDSCTLYKGSALYPRVVISLLAKWLEKPPFCHSYTSFGGWPRDRYMSLQRFTTWVCHILLRFPDQTVPACSAKVSGRNIPSCTMWERWFIKYVTKYDVIPHSTEQDTLPILFLISRQAIPYWIYGVTYCPRVPTPKIRSLADSRTTCDVGIKVYHKVWSTMEHKGSQWTQRAQRITQYQKAIPFPNHTLYSREDPGLPVTASSAIMIVVHFAKVNVMYPRVVISSPIGD
jgi:hypothetical protein